jgi:uncharacterized protein (DUF433 family)
MTYKIEDFVGQGIYTVPDVAKLTGVASQNIYNWLFGDRSTSTMGKKVKKHPALIHQYELMNHVANVSFRDMIQIRFVCFFRSQGVSLQTIRHAAENAAKLLSTTHPFCCAKFKTDGLTLLAEVFEVGGESSLIELKSMQHVFKEVIDPFLKSLEYEEDIVAKWWHCKGNGKVVLDPKLNFGKPTMSQCGYPTETLFDAYLANSKSVKHVSEWFEIPVEEVEEAIEFEMRLAA